MDLNEAIATRRAVRDYKPDALDDATIRALIDAAILAPSAMNEQPWTFTVVDSAAVPGRTFLLREFVTLLEPVSRADGSVEHARAVVAAADERRSKPPRDGARFGIPDPAGQSPRVMLATATEIDELVGRLVRSLFADSVRG